jgi:hypothetical protein
LLEAEPCLDADGSPTKGSLSLPKVLGCDVVRNLGYVKVEKVEQIEEISANFKLRVFAQNRHLWQTEGFGQRCIEIPVTRTIE